MNGNELSFAYDSANRLISAGQNSYTYNVEDVRVRNLCGESETTYAYNTNGKLSQLLVKTTDGIVTKYVYGLGLIGEETRGSFKTYHFDYRGSTTAITDINGNVTDTFAYDTYGNLISRTGTSVVIFLYNGRDGVVTDDNGLIYMRARYYSPELRRFINADIIAGEIFNAVTLNRYAYANGNPVSNIDPFGLSAERGNTSLKPAYSITYDQYIQILNSKLNSAFAPNKKGYGNIIATDTSNLQFFTTQKYIEKGFLKSEGWESITYVFATLSVNEWAKYIETTNLYNENIATVGGFIIDIGMGILGERYGVQGGDAISELYRIADEWASKELSNVILDEFSRYISNAISGKGNNERVSLFLGAYAWHHKADYFTGEWTTSYIGYGTPWSNEIIPNR